MVDDLSAEDLAATLETSCANRGGGGFLHPSALAYTCDYGAEEGSRLSRVVIDTGDGGSVSVVDESGAVDASVGPIDVLVNSFTSTGGDGVHIYYERSLREYLESFPPGDDGPPVVAADDPRYGNEEGTAASR